MQVRQAWSRAAPALRGLSAIGRGLAGEAGGSTGGAAATGKHIWNRILDMVGSDSGGGSSGLFGVEQLSSPASFEREAQRAVAECEELIRLVSAQEKPDATTVQMLDKISDVVCRVVDAAELCRHVHASKRWRDAAQSVFGSLSHFVFQLNSNRALFDAVDAASRDEGLDAETRRVARLLAEEFEGHGGIHLPPADRARVVDLHTRIGELCTTFTQNTLRRPPTFRVRPRSALRRLPRAFEPLFPPQPPDLGPDEAELEASTVLCGGIVRHVADSGVRQAATVASLSAFTGNLPVLHAVAKERHELATTLGYPSFAHMATQSSMAGNPNSVLAFLHDVSARLQGRASADRTRVKERAAAEAAAGAASGEAAPAPTAGGGETAWRGGEEPIEAWDLDHWVAKLRAEAGAEARRRAHEAGECGDGHESGSPSPVQWGDYLTLRNVVEALQGIVRDAFGVDMAEVAVRDGEGWGDVPGEVRKFVLRHPEEGELGTIFLDLYARPNKVSGAAQYVVRCGRRIHAFETAGAAGGDGPQGRTREEAGLEEAGLAASRGGYQLPIVALVTSFSRPSGSAVAGAGGWDAAVPLSVSQAETLFHEFGHALHSLLSRTSYQHVSGTRTALDFVEVPSHVFEAFATDRRVLTRFARHGVTGEPVPGWAVDALLAERRCAVAFDLQLQVVHAMFDQAVFSDRPMAVACSALDRATGALVVPDQHSSLCAGAVPAEPGARHPVAPFALAGSALPAAPAGSAPAPGHVWSSLPAGVDMAMRPDALNSSAVLREVTRRHGPSPHIPGTAWQGGFTHIVNYGASYYSYLYARVCAASLWERLFGADPFSREAGELYRREVLAKGGTEEPAATVSRVLGEPATPAALLRSLGIDEEAEAGGGRR